MKWVGHIARIGDMGDAHNIFVVKPEGKRVLGRSRYRWEDNIKMGLKQIGYGGVEWIHQAQDKVWSKGIEPSGSISAGSFVTG
jgi:hypothetical protein